MLWPTAPHPIGAQNSLGAPGESSRTMTRPERACHPHRHDPVELSLDQRRQRRLVPPSQRHHGRLLGGSGHPNVARRGGLPTKTPPTTICTVPPVGLEPTLLCGFKSRLRGTEGGRPPPRGGDTPALRIVINWAGR